ncbi:hypothetical protein [uncultured Desulfobacter sp.]|uniref:hypothetical protein n=1 Tax=uncultured Desulfobacter sp. TaxID=240139 RepID=UPI002AAC4252|nr:hypothetical protein [uncultured Desulfobacter sp.]
MKLNMCLLLMVVGMVTFCLSGSIQAQNYPETPDWVREALHPGSTPSHNQTQDQDSQPRYWPKSPNWVNDALHTKKHQVQEPVQAFPRPNQPHYVMICRECPHLYWFSPAAGFYRFTQQNIFRAPVAMCPGPRDGFLIMDLPRLTSEATILWQVSNQGQASALFSWQPGGLVKRPTQIAWIGNQLYVSDADNGLLAVNQNGSVQQLLYPGNIAEEGGQPMGPAKGRFGGLCTDGKDLFVAQGNYHKTPRNNAQGISFNTRSVPGCVMRLGSNGRTFVMGTDTGGALFRPKAMVLDRNGRLFVTDYGTKENKYASLKTLSQGRLIDVPVRIGNRSLRGPWGISLDRDGALLIADPFMWNAEGKSGIALKIFPGGQSRILFSGNGQHRPMVVLPGG